MKLIRSVAGKVWSYHHTSISFTCCSYIYVMKRTIIVYPIDIPFIALRASPSSPSFCMTYPSIISNFSCTACFCVAHTDRLLPPSKKHYAVSPMNIQRRPTFRGSRPPSHMDFLHIRHFSNITFALIIHHVRFHISSCPFLNLIAPIPKRTQRCRPISSHLNIYPFSSFRYKVVPRLLVQSLSRRFNVALFVTARYTIYDLLLCVAFL